MTGNYKKKKKQFCPICMKLRLLSLYFDISGVLIVILNKLQKCNITAQTNVGIHQSRASINFLLHALAFQ